MIRFTPLVHGLRAETAFTVLARARALKAQGKDVVELEIGDSPFPTTPAAKAAGIAAIEANRTGYAPSLGIPEFREAAARFVRRELHIPAEPENIVVASGAKPFQQFFAECFLEPGDGVLIFSPHFPTYEPNLARRGARAVLEPLRAEDEFRPRIEAVDRFLRTDPKPRSIWLNSPHNPTGGVATREDLSAIAELVRGTDVIVFSDEPYCHMVWGTSQNMEATPKKGTGTSEALGASSQVLGRHHSILERPGMLDQAVAAYTFSKSYSMSGWRIGFAVAHPSVVEAMGTLINTAASCSPPFVQAAAAAALDLDEVTKSDYMMRFYRKVMRLTSGLARIKGVKVVPPAGTFYVFPDVRALCERHRLTSHGLAMYLLEGADDHFGVACLGGECFGKAGAGFLRFSCAEPDERIDQAVQFLADAFARDERVARYRSAHPEYVLG